MRRDKTCVSILQPPVTHDNVQLSGNSIYSIDSQALPTSRGCAETKRHIRGNEPTMDLPIPCLSGGTNLPNPTPDSISCTGLIISSVICTTQTQRCTIQCYSKPYWSSLVASLAASSCCCINGACSVGILTRVCGRGTSSSRSSS